MCTHASTTQPRWEIGSSAAADFFGLAFFLAGVVFFFGEGEGDADLARDLRLAGAGDGDRDRLAAAGGLLRGVRRVDVAPMVRFAFRNQRPRSCCR